MTMIWYKVWRESQVRFFLGLAAISTLCLTDVFLSHTFMPQLAHQHPNVHTYSQYIYWKVYGGAVRGVTQLLCLLLGLGGLQRDRKQGTLAATLALPVPRSRWIATRAALGLAQVTALTLLPAILLWVASPLMGQRFPLTHSLPFVPLWMAGGALTFAISFLCSVLFQSEYTALTVAYVAYVFYLAGTHYPRLRPYPLNAGDLMNGWLGHAFNPHTLQWNGTLPLTILCGFFTVALCMLTTAAWITSRQDL